MKFDPAKSFPHPVLRPGSSDYLKAEFEVGITVQRAEKTTALRVSADFKLSDPDLGALVRSQRAHFLLVVRCSRTNFRAVYRAYDECQSEANLASGALRAEFADGEVASSVEVTPFCVAACALPKFHARNWNKDYRGLRFDLPDGAVLAMDAPEAYWVDTADESPISTMFRLAKNLDAEQGLWSCVPTEERVELRMHPEDHRRFIEARRRVGTSPEDSDLMNSVYLPALLHLLVLMDADRSEYESHRWFATVETRLNELDGCRPIGEPGADRLVDAQRILDAPFRRLPVLREEK